MARRRQRDSWGSISYDARSKTARIRYWAEGPDGYRRRSKTLRGVTRKEAEQARSALMLEHGEDAPCPTVGQAWERWALPEMRGKVECGDMGASSLRLYIKSYERDVGRRWGDVPCDQVRPLLVQQWISGMTHSSAKYAVIVLRKILDFATRFEFVQSNVMREKYVMPSKSTVKKRDDGTWTLDQLGTLWREVAYGKFWEAAFLLSAFGGCRVGESLGARSDDVSSVDVNGETVAVVEIRRQVSFSGVTDRLKTSWSYRPVVMAGRAAGRMLHLSELRDGWLCDDGVGGPCKRTQMRDAWHSEMEGVPEELRHPYKNLRNSWQTNTRWSLKLPPWVIEPMMGHVGEGTTGRHYDKPQAEMFAEMLADAYSEHVYDSAWAWLDS